MTRRSPSSESRRNALTVARYLHGQGVTVVEAEAMDLPDQVHHVASAGSSWELSASEGQSHLSPPWPLVVQKLDALYATQPADPFDRSTGLPGPIQREVW